MPHISTAETLQVSVSTYGIAKDRPRHIFLTETGDGQGAISYTGKEIL